MFKHWNELDGSKLFNIVFSYPVKIDLVDIFDIKIERGGPIASIEFDIVGHIPDRPPKKWKEKFNRCRCGLYCIGIKKINIDKIGTSMSAEITISQKNIIEISGDNVSIYIECDFLNLTGPSVYLSEPDE